MGATTVSVLIADDHKLLRQTLRNMLAPEEGFDVIGEAADGKETVALATRHQPDLVLLDLRMPETNGTEAIAAIKRYSRHTKILVVTAHMDEENLRYALNEGADGYLLKDDDAEALITAMRLVTRGGRPISYHLTHFLIAPFLNAHKASANIVDLTTKEREVVRLTASKKTAQQIANTLGMARKTVDAYRARIKRKTGYDELADYAKDHDLM